MKYKFLKYGIAVANSRQQGIAVANWDHRGFKSTSCKLAPAGDVCDLLNINNLLSSKLAIK